jgi:predicted transglutaminase-like cysteine proteinase
MFNTGRYAFTGRLGMRKAFVSTFLVLFFFISAVTELRASPDSDRDEPFDMGKLDLARFAARRGPTWREWRKIIANVEAEKRELAKCRTEPGRCSAAERRFETIVKEARSRNGRAKIEFVNERINGEIRYEPDTAQWGVEDAWSLPIDVNKEGSLNTGVGDCEDYVLAKYAALHQAGVPDKNLRMVLVRDNAVRVDHAVLAVRHDRRWLVLDNRWNKLFEDKELKQFKPLFVVERDGVKLLYKMFRLSDGKIIAPGTNPTSRAPVFNLKKN